MRKIIAALCGVALSCPVFANTGIWISDTELAALPTSGAAYNAIVSDAAPACGSIDLDDNFNNADQCVLANALLFARTGTAAYRTDVITALTELSTTSYPGPSPHNTTALPLGRNLGAYAISADLISLPTYDPALHTKVKNKFIELLKTPTQGGGSTSLKDCSTTRPNNHGTMCTASRLAVDAYINDNADLGVAANIFKGWLGDRTAYSRFSYDADKSWQANASLPVAINPVGATKVFGGVARNIDGVLPDDQRRGGSFTWPPFKENYVWEALQGATASAIILERKGYDSFGWSSQALKRAVTWLYVTDNYPADGDDTWVPYVINHFYGTNFSAPVPSQHGKNVGYTDWTLSGVDNPGSSPGTLQLSASTYTVSEGAGSVSIDVPRINGSDGAVGVSYATANGSALSPGDYTAANGTLSYADGVASNAVSIPIIEDVAVESNETFTFTLSNPTGGASLGSIVTGTVTITDNDVAQAVPGQLKFAAPTYSVAENVGSMSVAVSRVNGSDGTVGASYSTSDDTAFSGSDYTAVNGMVSLGTGVTSATISVPIINDTMALEGNEDFDVNLSNPTGGATLVDPVSTSVTIADDDDEATVFCLGAPATIVGTAGSDTLTGTSGVDVIAGLEGNDILKGTGGNDTICGGDGVDDLQGGVQNDTLSGGIGNDSLNGGGDTDSCNGGTGTDTSLNCETNISVP